MYKPGASFYDEVEDKTLVCCSGNIYASLGENSKIISIVSNTMIREARSTWTSCDREDCAGVSNILLRRSSGKYMHMYETHKRNMKWQDSARFHSTMNLLDTVTPGFPVHPGQESRQVWAGEDRVRSLSLADPPGRVQHAHVRWQRVTAERLSWSLLLLCQCEESGWSRGSAGQVHGSGEEAQLPRIPHEVYTRFDLNIWYITIILFQHLILLQ